MKKLFLLLFIMSCQYCLCQPKKSNRFAAQLNKADTVLYLFFQPECDRKATSGEFLNEGGSPAKQKMVIKYDFGSVPPLYNQYTTRVKSTERQPYVLMKIKKLRRKNIVTVGQLADFIAANYPPLLFPDGDMAGYGGRSYLDQLKEIYVLERTDRKNLVLVTKVQLYAHQ